MNEMEEISLYELIQIILKGWKTILISTIVTLLLTIGVYFISNTPTYSSNLIGTIFYTKDQITDVGQYSFPYSKSEDFAIKLKDKEFIQFISSKLKINESDISSSLNISSPNTIEYVLNIASSNLTTNDAILNKIKEYSEKYMNYVASKNAIEQIKRAQTQKLNTLNKQLSDKNRLLEYLNIELENTDKFLGNNINPTYSSLLNYKTRIEFEKTELEFALKDFDEISVKVNDFISKCTSFQDYLSSNQQLSISNIEIEYGQIQTTKAYRFNAKTLFPIASLLGFMLGVFIVFFKNYWISSSKIKSNIY